MESLASSDYNKSASSTSEFKTNVKILISTAALPNAVVVAWVEGTRRRVEVAADS